MTYNNSVEYLLMGIYVYGCGLVETHEEKILCLSFQY